LAWKVNEAALPADEPAPVVRLVHANEIGASVAVIGQPCCALLEPKHFPAARRDELPARKALLRLQHFQEQAPSANGGSAAVHLANFALHAVARRSQRLTDPRMRSLKSVGHLQVHAHFPGWAKHVP
jgi:hypothetical protein